MFFSERSALKLKMATHVGRTVTYTEDLATSLSGAPFSGEPGYILQKVVTFNTIQEGTNAVGERLLSEAAIVDGRIDVVGEVDQYRFRLSAGDFLNAESMSAIPEYADEVITSLALYYEDGGTLVKIAENFQEFESRDPVLFDVEIPQDGIYVLEVFAELACRRNQCAKAGATKESCCEPIEDRFPGDNLTTGDYTLFVYMVDRALPFDKVTFFRKQDGLTCKAWCAGNAQPWTTKCNWVNCNGCDDCFTCKSWCAGNAQPWTTKCNWVNCDGCGECNGFEFGYGQHPESPGLTREIDFT